MDNIKITDLPDGGAIVEHDGEVTVYTADEVAKMEKDYKDAILRLLNQNTHSEEVNRNMDKKETATKAEELGRKIEDGEITINQARVEMGLNPLDDKGADELLKRA